METAKPTNLRYFLHTLSTHGHTSTTAQEIFNNKYCAFDIDKYISNKFVHVQDISEADVIFFPYNIGGIIDSRGVKYCEELLEATLHSRYKSKYIFFDFGDSCECIKTEALVFAISLIDSHQANFIPLWYTIDDHIIAENYVWKFENHRYDVCFVGADSHPMRKAACMSIQKNNRLRSFISIIEGKYTGNIYYPPQSDATTHLKQREIFKRALSTTKLSLCPPGLGPHSIRLYESLYYGRIPVVYNNIPQFYDDIEYESFSLKIAAGDVLNTGDILYSFLHDTSAEKLLQMSLNAYKAYRKYFSAEKLADYIYKHIAEKHGTAYSL